MLTVATPGSRGLVRRRVRRGVLGRGPAGCVPGGPVAGATGIAVAPDGRSVAVAGSLSHGLTRFSRDPRSGGLALAGCGTDGRDGTDGACVDGDALIGPTAVLFDTPRLLAGSTCSGSVTAFAGAFACAFAHELCLYAATDRGVVTLAPEGPS